MLVEIAKPITLLISILSLYAVFHRAFLVPGSTIEDRLWSSLTLLLLSAGISLLGGLIFREDDHLPQAPTLTATLPVRLFLWASAIMALLFLASWYLETHCIFYRNVEG